MALITKPCSGFIADTVRVARSDGLSHECQGRLVCCRHEVGVVRRLRTAFCDGQHSKSKPISGRFAASSQLKCPAGLSPASLTHSGAISHVGALSAGRSPSFRANHPPGPLATYQGSAQVTGLLKERSQDYFVAATDIALDDDFNCSEAQWPGADGERHTSTDYASAAACSTSNRSTGVLSSMSSVGAPSIVVTGVFDGHGGETSARYAREAILSYIANDRQFHHSLGAGDAEATASALRTTFRKVDGELLERAASSSSSSSSSLCPSCTASADSATAPGAQQSNRHRAAGAESPSAAGSAGTGAGAGAGAGDFHDGTTALVTVQLGGLLAVANAGDSRAVMCRQGQAVRLSRDHTPALRAERERIEAAGGQVVVARGAARVLVPLAGNSRVMQALSVSRSLGDPDFKASGLIIADPDVSIVPLQQGEDTFLIAASDGLWGRVGDQEAVDCVNEVLEEYAAMSAPHNSRAVAAKAAARRLLRLALDQGSVDDVTVVVCVFAWA